MLLRLESIWYSPWETGWPGGSLFGDKLHRISRNHDYLPEQKQNSMALHAARELALQRRLFAGARINDGLKCKT